MNRSTEEIDLLLHRAARGEIGAMAALLTGQRADLTQFVASRLDRRVAARLDVADIVQDVLIEAACKFPKYIEQRPVPFPVWLQRLALECLAHTHRAHVRTKKRSVCREVQQSGGNGATASGYHLSRAKARDKTPSSDVAGKELFARVGVLMKQLSACDQEALRLRFVEQMPVAEVASRLGLTEGALRMRQLRALRQLRELLEVDGMTEDME
jgi:RNA polymerase sigma-70 factor (ECF subfamily)